MPPAESLFSNGIVERHNKVIYETMMKTKDDAKCEPEIALAWVRSSKIMMDTVQISWCLVTLLMYYQC